MARKKRSSEAQSATPKEKFRLAHQLPKADEPKAYSSGSDSESDEIEDEYGDLATAEIDKGILEIIDAARSDPSKLLDKSKEFFPDVNSSTEPGAQKSKPVYLKDYHRQQLLDGKAFESDDDDEQKPKVTTYAEEREQERVELLNAVKAQGLGDADEEDDDFLVKRKDTDSAPVDELELPDPEKDEDGFLRGFITSGGWIPKDVDRETGEKVVPSYEQLVEEDDWSEDDLADQYESSYNFRFEDPEAEKVFSYARDQITARRSELSGRKRLREKNRAEKEAEDRKAQAAAAKKKKKVINDVASRMEELLSAVGDEDLAKGLAEQDLDGDWDSNEWDKRMLKMFGDDFYQKGDDTLKPSEADHADGDDAEPSNEEDDISSQVEQIDEAASQQTTRKLSKKELRKKAAELVEASKDLLAEPEDDSQGPKFVYRDVEPENFGLSARDILLADDKQLNSYVGLKHLASYRDQERVARDRKKYAKKRRLREWRKETFQTEEEPSLELWKKMQAEAAEAAAQDLAKKQPKGGQKRKNNDRKGKSSKRARR